MKFKIILIENSLTSELKCDIIKLQKELKELILMKISEIIIIIWFIMVLIDFILLGIYGEIKYYQKKLLRILEIVINVVTILLSFVITVGVFLGIANI